jgi:hypothetical protein
MRGHQDGFASLEEVADAIAAYNPHRKRPSSLDGLRKNVRLHDDGRWNWHRDPSFMRLGREADRDANSERLASAAARIDIPTLIVRGRQSDVVNEAGEAGMTRLIPSWSRGRGEQQRRGRWRWVRRSRSPPRTGCRRSDRPRVRGERRDGAESGETDTRMTGLDGLADEPRPVPHG